MSCSISHQEFEIAGESKTAEGLGFNTDLSKAQVITKDEDKVLNVNLYTDLLNKEKMSTWEKYKGLKIEKEIKNDLLEMKCQNMIEEQKNLENNCKELIKVQKIYQFKGKRYKKKQKNSDKTKYRWRFNKKLVKKSRGYNFWI